MMNRSSVHVYACVAVSSALAVTPPPPPRRGAKRPLSTALTNAPHHDWTFSWFLWPIPSTQVNPLPSQANTALSPVLARTMRLSFVSGAVRSQSRQKCQATVQTLGLLGGLNGPRSSNFAAPNLKQAYSCQPPHLHSLSVPERGYDLEQVKLAQQSPRVKQLHVTKL